MNNNRVLLSIPVPIWEVIRSRRGMSFEYADMIDAELRSFVESEVDERLKCYAEATDTSKTVASLFGSIAYGLANQPREEQIVAGITYFTIIRDKQRETLQAISEKVQLNK